MRRRMASLSHVVGVGPVILFMTAGVAVVAAQAGAVRAAVDSGTVSEAYLLGLVLVFVPAAVGIAAPRVRAGTPLALAAATAVLTQLVYVLAGTLPADADTTSLGLDVVTRSVRDLFSVSETVSATVVLASANLLLAATILLLIWHVTRSARIGALAVFGYVATTAPGDFRYASVPLALALAVLVAYLVVTRQRGVRRSLVGAVLALVAVALTDLGTSVVVLVGLVGWLVLEVLLRRKRTNSVRALVVLVVAALVVTAVGVARREGVPGLDALPPLAVRGDQPVPWVAGADSASWTTATAMASAILVLLVLGLGLWRSRFFVPLRVSLAVMLALTSVLQVLVFAGHITAATAGFAVWAPRFTSVAVAFVAAWWFFQRRPVWWRAALLGAAVAVLVVGTVVGYAGTS